MKKEIRPLNLLEKYNRILDQADMKAKAEHWIFGSLAISVALGLVTFLILFALNTVVSPFMGLVIFIAVLDLSLGYPYLRAEARIDKIEAALPDTLKQIADTLKAGGTYEFALREVAISQYGPLSDEMNNVLRKLEEGENLENSLRTLSDNIDSRIVKRSMEIIIDSIKAGAGLADVLDSIADDVSAMHQIKRGRKAQTLMQFLFLLLAGAAVAPAIIGLVTTVISLFIKSASTGFMGGEEAVKQALESRDIMALLMQVYLFIEIIATGVMISLMRTGKITKSILYIPILLLIAYISYYGALILSSIAVGGVI